MNGRERNQCTLSLSLRRRPEGEMDSMVIAVQHVMGTAPRADSVPMDQVTQWTRGDRSMAVQGDGRDTLCYNPALL